MKVWLVQMDVEVNNRDKNLHKILGFVEKGVKSGANLIVFGELILSGYMCKNNFFELAEPIPGPSTNEVAALVRNENTYVVFGMPEAHLGSLYNSAPMVGPNGIVGTCRKLYPATFASPTAGVTFDEGVYFKPGQDIAVFDTPFGKIGIQICLDVWYPEVARAQALAGAWLILHPAATAIRVKGAQLSPYSTMRSKENMAYWCTVNSVGEQAGTKFQGGTRLIDPNQGILKMASLYEPAEDEKPARDAVEEVLEFELDSKPIYDQRLIYPQLRDARPEVMEILYREAKKARSRG